MNLTGKIALITGASSGIGKEIAYGLAQRGAHVIIHHCSAQKEARITQKLINRMGGSASLIHADLRKPAAIAKMFSKIHTEYGTLDILINNASTICKNRLHQAMPAEWEAVMSLNLRAPLLCSQHMAARYHKKSKRPAHTGVIINVSDLSGIHPWQGYSLHSVSRAGLMHLTKALARDLAPHLRVNTLALGLIVPPTRLITERDIKQWHRMQKKLPLQRHGNSSCVTKGVIFLAESDFTTGALVTVDGGEILVGPVMG